MTSANFYWDGELSKFQEASLLSFVKKNFEVNLWTYTNDIKVPDGVNIVDARKLLPESLIGKYTFSSHHSEAKNKYAIFSDLLRAAIVNDGTNWWFDIDCFCLKDVKEFEALAEKNDFIVGKQSEDVVNATVLFFSDKNMSKEFLDLVFLLAEKSEDRTWAFTGPRAITNFLKEKDIFELSQPIQAFYPISHVDYSMAYKAEYFSKCLDLISDSYVYHWWSSMNSFGEILFPENGSLLHYLFKQVNIEI